MTIPIQKSITNCYSKHITVSVSVHQGSVLSPLQFIIAMEALSHEFRIRCLWELLYANNFVILAESLDELKMRLTNWKERLEVKGLKVNVGKTKAMCSRYDALNTSITSVKVLCGVCWKGVRTNSILCLSCRKWVHKQCFGIRESLRYCKDFIYKTNSTVAEADDPFRMYITIDGDVFESVSYIFVTVFVTVSW